ncbi:uncharacterized protein AB675_7616 [Cyphellophora attinorum]|uniref:Uncharacterized protein n=1 Tax=Cyphellophora attinorum TaxID=1664694 RepID=A0A0N0NMB5_9EURO|nr:uncharacterized protein AB675_7616 [Phialophora attinorum]KPI40261.1 hypothetical protein AB675_7616 [Phialophora attinorum]
MGKKDNGLRWMSVVALMTTNGKKVAALRYMPRSLENCQSDEKLSQTIDGIPGLFKHEHTVARKCLEEAKHMRRMFASGKYFKPLVHQVKENVNFADAKSEVKATFISIPVFSSMHGEEPVVHHDKPTQQHGMVRQLLQTMFEKTHKLVHAEAYSKDHHQELATKELRKREGHPIRSLMQYTNILAPGLDRDWHQAMVRLENEDDHDQPLIHVPEFWAVIINTKTIVTCSPFSVEELLGENITHQKPDVQDMRIHVEYTNLGGAATHEFRCRTWVGFLNTVAAIERQIPKEDELSVQLSQDDSAFKIVDANFRLINRSRWQDLTASKNVTEFFSKGLKQSNRKVVSQRDRTEHLAKLRRIDAELKVTRASLLEARRIQLGQRLLYAAVRYQLIDPGGVLLDEDAAYLEVRLRRKAQEWELHHQTRV